MLDKFAKKESPILGYAGFGGGVSSLLTLASGKITYVDDVFSTYLYDGNGSDRTITNGIDLAGEGGIVWTKCRNDTPNHQIDYIEGTTRYDMYTDLANSATITDLTDTSSYSSGVDQYNSDGYRIKNGGANTNATYNSRNYVSWTFRKCPGFFDIVTYTSQSGVTAINHNLGSVPGCIMVKKLNGGTSWQVYHRSSGAGKEFELDGADGERTNNAFPSTPTSTQFFISPSNNNVFGNVGDQFIAYLFAHNDGSFGEDSDEAVIKCDHYNGSGSSGKTVDLGFEPQWVLIKKATATGSNRSWWLGDIMRSMPAGTGDLFLQPNNNAGDSGPWDFIDPTPTGFTITTGDDNFNTSGVKYNYIAIRRPHKAPEAGTEVFAANLLSASNNGIQNVWTPGFVPDALFVKKHETSDDMRVATRMSGKRGFLVTNGNNAEPGGSTDYYHFDDSTNTIHQTYIGGGSDGTINYAFKRAPGFFDIVAYNGSNSAQNISHNLGSKPALIICKRRNSTGNWQVYADVPAGGATKYMMLDDTGIFNTNSNRWNNTEPTATQFTLGTYSDLNTSGGTYLAYLFGNLDGICKIGEYAGTGNDITIDCGFNPRFIMIKQCTGQGDGWYIVDYVRGINAGNDPWIRFNQSNAQITSTDIVDSTSGGFIVQAGGGGRVNDADGRKYLYWAIA